MERYTIRILYRDRENPGRFVGLVESDGDEGGRGFVNKEGLWKILGSPDRGPYRHTNFSLPAGPGCTNGYLKEILQIISEEC